MTANKAIFLLGPTACGKTALALRLAKHYKIEIVSVDAALIYRDLDIGSAKPNSFELNLVPHHLINIVSPLDSYSVAEFLRDCKAAIAAINARGNIPLLVGGTMMYFNALIHGISQLPSADPTLRSELTKERLNYGNQVLYDRLARLDPVSALKIEVNDSQRLERALEVCILTGKPMSVVKEEYKLPGLSDCNYLALAIMPGTRELLHSRINQRYIDMLANGFADEVKGLRQKYPELTGAHNSMRCVGYRQVWDYLDGKLPADAMLLEAQAATRQLAKRQLTWLRSLPVTAIDDSLLDLDNLERQLVTQIEESNILELV